MDNTDPADQYHAGDADRNVLMVALAVLLVFAFGVVFTDVDLSSGIRGFVVRLMMSMAAACLAAFLPGYIGMTWERMGLAVRAGGALAVFVLTFVYTPEVFGQVALPLPTGSLLSLPPQDGMDWIGDNLADPDSPENRLANERMASIQQQIQSLDDEHHRAIVLTCGPYEQARTSATAFVKFPSSIEATAFGHMVRNHNGQALELVPLAFQDVLSQDASLKFKTFQFGATIPNDYALVLLQVPEDISDVIVNSIDITREANQ